MLAATVEPDTVRLNGIPLLHTKDRVDWVVPPVGVPLHAGKSLIVILSKPISVTPKSELPWNLMMDVEELAVNGITTFLQVVARRKLSSLVNVEPPSVDRYSTRLSFPVVLMKSKFNSLVAIPVLQLMYRSNLPLVPAPAK